MARQMHPRRGSGARLGLTAPPPSASLEGAVLAELVALREAVAAVERRLVAPAAETQALARSADAQRRKLDELATALGEVRRRQGEAAKLLADLQEARSWPNLRHLAGVLRDAATAPRRQLSRLGRWTLPWRTAKRAAHAVEPAPVLNWVLAGAQGRGQCRAVLAVVFKLSSAEIAALAARLSGKVPAGVIPVFVTDHSDFAPFRAHRACFEYLPDRRGPSAGAAPRDWELYRARRFALLCDKWKPLRVVAFGAEATRQLARWSRSPHLSGPTRELLGAGPAAGVPDEVLARSPAR
ncbi:MAG TPA: hypothetical protein VFY87_06015 [Geminicoccaceae bacterium]|nr:hypothetical protein [Geminicoccaceae bacterium]